MVLQSYNVLKQLLHVKELRINERLQNSTLVPAIFVATKRSKMIEVGLKDMLIFIRWREWYESTLK